MISICLFGKLTVTDSDGKTIPISGAKSQGLVAYLALNTEMPPSRDRLMSLFWGDRFTDQARQSLRQAVAKLRRTFPEPDAILALDDRVGLNPDLVRVDVDEFTALADDPDPTAVRRARELLTGPLLDGLYGQQADFEDWIASERQRFASLTLRVLERAAELELQQGNTDQALDVARSIVAIEPLRDASQMVLIRMLAQKGERAAAVQQFNSYEALLHKELGVGAGPELMRLMAEVRGEGFFASQTPETASEPPPDLALPATARTSIAVVPFARMGGDDDLGFLIDGLTEDISRNLSLFSWLDVKASSEGSDRRMTGADMSALGKELGLDYIVHGSLRAIGEKIRLTVQLADPKSARYLWVMRYDRTMDDPFALQDELSATIAASIETELVRFAGRETREIAFESMNAWDAYHRGLAIQYEFSADTNALAQTHFRRAIELDPNFGLAYARLSYAMVISAIYFEADNLQSVLDEALELAQEAARLDPGDAVVRFALGRVHLARGEYDRSITDLKAAIDLNPGMAQAHCGLGDSLAYSGQLDTAMGCFEEAVRINPSDPYRWAFLSYGATALLFKGDFDDAVDWAQQAEAVPNSHYWPTAIRASALAHAGHMERAADALADLRRMRPGITADFVRERLFYLRDPDQIDIYVDGLVKAGLE